MRSRNRRTAHPGARSAVANILYFLHPTFMPPFNTAMVNGLSLRFGERVKLGSRGSYLLMRQKILSANHRDRIYSPTILGGSAAFRTHQAVTAGGVDSVHRIARVTKVLRCALPIRRDYTLLTKFARVP